jgi:hypothetical protein
MHRFHAAVCAGCSGISARCAVVCTVRSRVCLHCAAVCARCAAMCAVCLCTVMSSVQPCVPGVQPCVQVSCRMCSVYTKLCTFSSCVQCTSLNYMFITLRQPVILIHQQVCGNLDTKIALTVSRPYKMKIKNIYILNKMQIITILLCR